MAALCYPVFALRQLVVKNTKTPALWVGVLAAPAHSERRALREQIERSGTQRKGQIPLLIKLATGQTGIVAYLVDSFSVVVLLSIL